jgi:hypothetical protein
MIFLINLFDTFEDLVLGIFASPKSYVSYSEISLLQFKIQICIQYS